MKAAIQNRPTRSRRGNPRAFSNSGNSGNAAMVTTANVTHSPATP